MKFDYFESSLKQFSIQFNHFLWLMSYYKIFITWHNSILKSRDQKRAIILELLFAKRAILAYYNIFC